MKKSTGIVNARLVTPDGIIDKANVRFRDGKIESVSHGGVQARNGDIDAKGDYLLPGFIDIHVHPPYPKKGKEKEYISHLSKHLFSIGTTGFLWTIGNTPLNALIEQLTRLRDILLDPPHCCACLGLYLEGPYISPHARGGFKPECTASPEEFPLEKLLKAGGSAIKYINISPDVPGAVETIRKCVQRGIRVAMGHSLADTSAIQRAIEAGTSAVTHTFNNVHSFPMKEGGVWGTTMDTYGMSTDTVVNELICDGKHVDPVLVRTLKRSKREDSIILVTDSPSGGKLVKEGTIMRDGNYRIIIRGGVGRNMEGGVSGSALTMERALRNYIKMTGCGLSAAMRASSLNAALFLGMEGEMGTVSPGKRADCVLLTPDLYPRMSFHSGTMYQAVDTKKVFYPEG